jgi:hypothetical protein
MANKQRGEVAVTFGDQEVTVRVSMNLIAELEEAVGSLTGFAEAVFMQKSKITDLAKVLKISLRTADKSVTDADIENYVIDHGASGVSVLASKILVPILSGQINNLKALKPGEE